MNRLKKFIKVLLIAVVSFAGLLYGTVFIGHKIIFKEPRSEVATIASVGSDDFAFGAQEQQQATIMTAFISLFASQIRRYNAIAPGLWPDNAVHNQAVIVECIEDGDFWLIRPDGTITPLSKKEALARNIRRVPYFNGFSYFDNNDVQGYYLALSKEDLNNYLIWDYYLHLGTYDPFITYCHELFHEIEQTKWAEPDVIANPSRNNYLEDTGARAKRNLLLKQLMLAVSDVENQEQHILDALATYEDYKVQFPDDYEHSQYFDRVEGTAFYFEIAACLYAAYPDKIKDENDLHRAWSLLATRSEYIEYGVTDEAYKIGGFACVLLDSLHLDDDWKSELMADPNATPLTMLSKQFNNAALPEPVALSQSDIDKVAAEIAADQRDARINLFKMAYQIMF